MATVNFSIPDDVKQEFNRLFANENKSALLTRLMQQAIEDYKRKQRRRTAMDKILELRETLPAASQKQIDEARAELRS